jgi:hypothetical protein
VHLTGAVRSVELAAIGRRVAEQEWDLLELLAPDEWMSARALPPDEHVVPTADPGLYGRPTIAELVEAAREYVSGPVMDATTGAVQFHARVTANVLATVERQLAFGRAPEDRFRDGLAALGASSAADLAAAIAAGQHDDHIDELYRFLARSVRDRLAVANPKHLAR